MTGRHEYDPRGLIHEAYAIDGIGVEECRSVFLDWALFDDHAIPQRDRIATLLNLFEPDHPDHPMTAILRAGLEASDRPGRRGGRRRRRGGDP